LLRQRLPNFDTAAELSAWKSLSSSSVGDRSWRKDTVRPIAQRSRN
jgi:hypothetical protein